MRIKIQNFVLFLVCLWRGITFFPFCPLCIQAPVQSFQRKLDVLKATSLGTLLLYLATPLFDLSMISDVFLLVFWSASTFICVSSRIVLRRFLAWLRLRGRNLRYMLIVGTNERAIRFAKRSNPGPSLGTSVLGFVDNEWNGNGGFGTNGYRIVADFHRFPSFIRENAVDEVVLCLPIKSFYDQISTISKQCEEQGLIVRHLSDLFNITRATPRQIFSGASR
jgi:FlaA1/EpsC-like NDP-sugar epimerase